ncbi:MAG: hypothetical protein E6Q44_03025, partial [Flavobacteriales bacterium]
SEVPRALVGFLAGRVILGFFVVLFFGKPLCLLSMGWVLVRWGVGRLPAGTGWTQMLAISILSGLGFTMAVFINELAFDDVAVREQAKLGILFASVLAATLGALLFRFFSRKAVA